MPSGKRKDNTSAAPIAHGVSLNGDITGSEPAALNHQLTERVKELNCLYSISRLAEDRTLSVTQIVENVVRFIPPAWQYPDITCASVTIGGRRTATPNYKKTRWNQNEDIVVNGEKYGRLGVYYLEERPESDEGPFLNEERALIHAIAERLGHIIERTLAEENIQKSYEEEKLLRERLQAEMDGRVQFTRNLIHELKTPLTSLVATSQLLLDEEEDEKLGRLARYVWEGAQNVNNRINELHDIVKGEIGTLEFDPQPLDIAELLTKAVGEISALAEQHEVNVSLKTGEPLPEVYADPVRVRQILSNLLNNAFRYASEGGRVEVKATPRAGEIMIEVRDWGPGIDQEKQQHLFESGYHTNRHVATSGGLGIGLALSKLLIELHGGKIWAKNRKPKGTSFYFTLPKLKN